MNIGTKSLLYGAHQFAIHPVMVFFAWWRLYGFPWDPRLWIVFFVHDWGYWGKPNMDGEEGETHVELGGKIVSFLFDTRSIFRPVFLNWIPDLFTVFGKQPRFLKTHMSSGTWYLFSIYHSRFWAKADQMEPSALCAADKLATCITPRFLYMPLVRATGEVWEYVQHFKEAEENRGKYAGEVRHFKDICFIEGCGCDNETREQTLDRWYSRMIRHMKKWAYTKAPKLNDRKRPRLSEIVFDGEERCDICLAQPKAGELAFAIKRPSFCCVESACESCAWKLRNHNSIAA